MSGVEPIVIISIIANIIALVDYGNRVLRRVDDYGGKSKSIPKAFRNLTSLLSLVAITLSRTIHRIDAVEFDARTCATLHPVVEDCQAQLTELKILLEKTLPKDDDTLLKIIWKALYSVRQDKKIEAISVAIQRYVVALTMCFAETAALASHDLLLITTSISMNVNRAPDDPCDQRHIQITDVMGRTHQVPLAVCKTAKGFVSFLMFAFKDCRMKYVKRRIECGEFWLVDRETNYRTNSRRTIRSLPAILADTWEENAQPGKSFSMIIEDDLTLEELELVHRTWEEHLVTSLAGIFEVTDWQHSEVL